jgi:putative acyl-CoA dehydrogenase
VLRALRRDPDSLATFLEELGAAAGADPRLDAFITGLQRELDDAEELESRARWIVERMALALQGALLVRYAAPAVADAFCSTRLADQGGRAFGTLPVATDARAIVERARVKVD